MSQERIELVERVLDAWNRRSVDELLALSHAEAEYVNPPDALEPGTRTGHDGLITVMTNYSDSPAASRASALSW